ncbi:MAG: D-Ala-D-Ala carboxypeptidase family metallohydrolase [Gemmatimonadales bacterium]
MRILRNWKAFAILGLILGPFVLILLALAPPPGRAMAVPGVEPASAGARRPGITAGFRVLARGQRIPYRVFGLFVLPGERVDLQMESGTGGFVVEADSGVVEHRPPTGWAWTAPRSIGVFPVEVIDVPAADTIRLNAFVMVPYGRQSTLNGYRIGRYEQGGLALRSAAYAVPGGMIEVTPENQDVPVSPHFTLGQFVARQAGGYPKYLVLQEKLLIKLELVLAEAQRRGIKATSFTIMSGYRTPFYNRAIGNETRFSRHLYGDAADIYVDENGDGVMDDLNGDHRVTRDDARVLARVVDDLSTESGFQSFLGGLGLYRTRPNHGPFIHVDTRGTRTRWEQ